MFTPVSQCHVYVMPGRDVACPAPSHHRLLPLANYCLAMCPNPTAATLGHRTSDPDILSILSPLAFHHSPAALSIPFSSPHRPSPILATFLSMTCVLKRFLLTSLRKLPLTCVKRGFLRTAEPHRTSQLSPYPPLMSQCHVYVMPGRDVPCPTPSPRCHHTFAPLPCTCTRLSLSQVFDHYQHFANSVVEVYISFKKKVIFENVKSLIHLLL